MLHIRAALAVLVMAITAPVVMATGATADDSRQMVISSRQSAPQSISVEEYLGAGGSKPAEAPSAQAPQCWSVQFVDTLSIGLPPLPGQRVFAEYGYTGKWCVNNGTMWRMAIMNVFVQSVGLGTVTFSEKTHRTVGRTVWNNKYAIGVEQFTIAGTIKIALVDHKFAFDRCLRSWGDRYGNAWKSKSCSVL